MFASIVNIVRPKEKSFLFDLFCIGAGSLFIALLAQISIPLWFTPIPLSLQTLAVSLIAATLGSKRGALAILTYLAEGAVGLPVFAGGVGGIAKLFGTNGGYLFGFVLAAYIIGLLLEKGWKEKYLLTLAALYLGSFATLSLGAFWLSFYTGGVKSALALGVYPFLIGDTIKSILGAGLILSGRRLTRWIS
ncbi:MAG: biotin transporter BioY [Chlamydiales bacterium]